MILGVGLGDTGEAVGVDASLVRFGEEPDARKRRLPEPWPHPAGRPLGRVLPVQRDTQRPLGEHDP